MRLSRPGLFALCLALVVGCGGAKQRAAQVPSLKETGPTLWEPFSAWGLTRGDGPPIDVYVARRDGPRPTVLLLPGSQCLPLFWVLPGRRISPLFLQGAVPGVLDRVNVVAFDRRGLKSFGPPPASEEAVREQARCTVAHGGVSKAERVADAAAVARALRAQPWVSELYVLGHSEGGDVAAGLARLMGDDVAAVGLFAGAGITRFFDRTMRERPRGGTRSVVRVFEQMLAATGPQPPAELEGDPLEQVRTYALDSTPLDDLRGLRVPVFVAHGDLDEKVPVEAADAFVAELLRESRRSVRYLLVPGADHGFFDDQGREHAEAAFRTFLEWAGSREKARAVGVLPISDK